MVCALLGALTLWKETEGFTGAALVKVLIQDQILYFLMYVYSLYHSGDTIIHSSYVTSAIICSISKLISYSATPIV